MDEPLRWGQVRLRVHGHKHGARDVVLASVFAEKMAVLVRALRAADSAVNNRAKYDYVISRLSDGSATVEIEEQRKRRVRHSVSSVEAFDMCLTSVNDGNFDHARKFGRCAAYVPTLARGADESFSYGELWINGHTLIRVDSLLGDQGRAAITPPESATEKEARRWFSGVTTGSFVGHLLEVDFRGALPLGKLITSAGRKEIDCVFREEDIEKIRETLRNRVRVHGRVRYDGTSGLARRIEVRRIDLLSDTAEVDFSKWAGAFVPFEREEWES